MKEKVFSCVINTSPWIALSACNQTELLQDLYEIIMMPTAVKDEILAGGKNALGVSTLKKANWLEINDIENANQIKLLHELDQGEAEVLILAAERDACEVILDEKVARMHAHVLGHKVIGTLGIILRAKKKGLIDRLEPLIGSICGAGIYIHKDIIRCILMEAGEYARDRAPIIQVDDYKPR